MFPFLGPPLDVQLASAIRQALVVAWWLMPLAFVACAVHFARKGDRRGQKLLTRLALVIVGGWLLLSVVGYAMGSVAAHGSASFLKALLSTGTCLFAPGVFCPWPEAQLVIVPAIYLLLLVLVVRRRGTGAG